MIDLQKQAKICDSIVVFDSVEVVFTVFNSRLCSNMGSYRLLISSLTGNALKLAICTVYCEISDRP